MSTKPTPGPMTWHTREDGSKVYTIGDFRDELAEHAQGDIEICEDDMRRIAAAWNACEGVPTEVLETNAAGGLPWSVADQIDTRVSVSELLRTMGALLAACDRWEMPGVAEIAQARAAYGAAGGEL